MIRIITLPLLLLAVSVSAGDIVAHAHTASSDECTKYCSSAEQPILRIDTIPLFIEAPGVRIYSGCPNTRIDTIYVDTARYYAEVDTCLTCPKGYRGGGALFTINEPLQEICWPRDSCLGDGGWVYPDTSLAKKWYPKIQGWWTRDEIEKLKKLLK